MEVGKKYRVVTSSEDGGHHYQIGDIVEVVSSLTLGLGLVLREDGLNQVLEDSDVEEI